MGGTLASAVEAGERVVVVTATRGEEGEIHNRDDADEIRPRLGELREEELRASIRVLGVEILEFLDYRDSGMMGTEANSHPDAFWNADFMEATERLVRIIRRHQPEVITAYDAYGGYGHPDHIQVHRIGTAAFFGAADIGRFPLVDAEEPWHPTSLFWSTWPRERMRRMRRRLATTGELGAEEAAVEPGAGSLERHITTTIDVTDFFDHKHEALLCHDSQFATDSWVRTIPRESMRDSLGYEPFIRVFSTSGAPAAEPDLFAGLR